MPTDDLRPEYLKIGADFAQGLQTTPAHAAFRDLLLRADRCRANLFDINTPAMPCFAASPGNTWIGRSDAPTRTTTVRGARRSIPCSAAWTMAAQIDC
ncbi:MAG TPA: hypothetical protein EYQ31_12250 [Candidatus Handelsmanbacteria bacterium]|nr:hypothetical protein [Candidatus Handelsmanbacteria bacterium]